MSRMVGARAVRDMVMVGIFSIAMGCAGDEQEEMAEPVEQNQQEASAQEEALDEATPAEEEEAAMENAEEPAEEAPVETPEPEPVEPETPPPAEPDVETDTTKASGEGSTLECVPTDKFKARPGFVAYGCTARKEDGTRAVYLRGKWKAVGPGGRRIPMTRLEFGKLGYHMTFEARSADVRRGLRMERR